MQEAPGRKRTDIFEYVHNSRPQACPHLEGADQTATYLNVSCRIWPCPGPPHSERIVLYLSGPGAGQARQEANVSQRIPLYRVLVLAPGAWKSDVSHVSWCIGPSRGGE